MKTQGIRISVCLVVAAGVIAAFAPSAGAALILPGQAIVAPADANTVSGGGLTLVGGGTAVSFASATFTGTLTASVYAGDSSNPFGLGALTFTYLLQNDSTSPDAIGRFTTNGFSGFSTEVSYQPGVGQAPTWIDRSTLALGGDVVGFTFFGAPIGVGTLPPGQSSTLLVVQTNATSFYRSYSSVIDGSVVSVASFAPVPEPATLALLALGLGGVIIRRKRR